MVLFRLLVAVMLWLKAEALAPARVDYVRLEQEIANIYGLSAKVPPSTYVLVTNTITITRVESTSGGEVIVYGDIKLRWDDETIAWDPRNFKNITYTLLHSTTIWYPRPRFRNARHTISDQLIEADYKGKCQCRVHFSVTLMQALFQRVILQLQIGEDESSVMLSPAQIKVMEAMLESSTTSKISFVDQWHDKRLPNVLNVVFELSEHCEIGAKRVLMMCSQFIGQISTLLTKPQNVHRITILLLSTLLALTESTIADCTRPSDHVISLALLITIIAETFSILMIYRLRKWILTRRSQRSTSLPFYEVPLRPTPMLESIRESSLYQPSQDDLQTVNSRRPRSVMLPSDLPLIPLSRTSGPKTRQQDVIQSQLEDVWEKLIIVDRICAAVIVVCYAVLEAALA